MMKFIPTKSETEQKVRQKPGRTQSLIATQPHDHQKPSLQSENARMGENITTHMTDKVLISGTPINK